MTQGGKSGWVEIPWITNSTVYEFRLYPVSGRNVAMDSAKTRREIESAPLETTRVSRDASAFLSTHPSHSIAA